MMNLPSIPRDLLPAKTTTTTTTDTMLLPAPAAGPDDVLREAARLLMDAGPGHREVRFNVARLVFPLRLSDKDPRYQSLIQVARLASDHPDDAERDLKGAIAKLQEENDARGLDVETAPWISQHEVAAAAAAVLCAKFQPVVVNDALRTTVPDLGAAADSARAAAFQAIYQQTGYFRRGKNKEKIYCAGPNVSAAVFDAVKRRSPIVRIGKSAFIGGHFIDRPGLHAGHGYYCSETTPAVEYHGSAKQAVIELYEALFQLFPLVDEDHLVRLFAAILTPFLMMQIAGAVPGILITAPNRGDGKTLLGKCIALLADGETVVIPWGEGAKFEENLLAALDSDCRVVIVDNVKGELGGSTIEALLTTRKIRANLKYEGSRIFDADKLIIITGVNVILTPDMARRVMRILVDRQGLPQPEDMPDLLTLIPADRARLLGMIKTILTTWDGSMLPVTGHKTYEQWAGTIGGILRSCGVVNGPMTLIDPLALAADHDADAIKWGELLENWYGQWADSAVGASEILAAVGAATVRRALAVRSDEARQLGAALSGMNGRIIDGYRFSKEKQKVYTSEGQHEKNVYRLLKVGNHDS